MTDPIDEAFAGLSEEYYPGSKQRRPSKPQTPEPVPVDAWDEGAKPKLYKVQGREYEFFTIGVLARALNRQVVTIRKWEQIGVLPRARFRDSSGRRAYTRRQIEGLRQLAHECDILAFDVRPDRIPDRFKEGAVKIYEEPLDESSDAS